MAAFRVDPSALAASRGRAAARARQGQGPVLVDRARAGHALSPEELATLLVSADVKTAELLALAADARPAGMPIETFSPLYLTNECDAECAMCGMRAPNRKLVRQTADAATAEEQLDILHGRGLRAVAILTGEYRLGPRRREMIARSAAALRAALSRGFEHVLINIGALEEPEYALLLDGVARSRDGRIAPRVTMCTFQETYHPDTYRRFMGSNPDNPRSHFERRLQNFDRAADAGMVSVNPGILLGLHRDLAFELLALLAHVEHLRRRGLRVYISLPRLRKASGAAHRAGIADDTFFRVAALLAFGAPDARVVISTREPPAVQRQLLPILGSLTPGSPGVAPYTATGARFELEASQFEVLDERPIERVLGDLLAAGVSVDCYEPGSGA